MGMTDKQFNGFLRMLYDLLEDARHEEDPKKREEKFRRLSEHLRDTIED